MIEQDYIMRLIKEMIRFLLKLIFNIDSETPTAEIMKDKEAKNVLEELFDRVDAGKINDAENKLYSIVDETNVNYLEIALLFYSYLNDKDDIFLEENGFSRKEIKMGLEDMSSKYGLNGIMEIFLN
ncbi:MAG: DUF6483 family protein [Lachnospiraceae bacterium]